MRASRPLALAVVTGLLLYGTLPTASATSFSSAPYYVIKNLAPLEKLLNDSDFAKELEGIGIKRVQSSWKDWDACGVNPVGVRRYPKHGVPFWKFWVVMPWMEQLIPNDAVEKVLACKKAIPLSLTLSLPYKGKRWELYTQGVLKDQSLTFSASPKLIKNALEELVHPKGPITVSGQKIRLSHSHYFQIWAWEDLVRMRGFTVDIENKIPISMKVVSFDYPIKSWQWVKDKVTALNGDEKFVAALSRLGYKGEPLVCEGMCRMKLCGGRVDLMHTPNGRSRYRLDGKINWRAYPKACP